MALNFSKSFDQEIPTREWGPRLYKDMSLIHQFCPKPVGNEFQHGIVLLLQRGIKSFRGRSLLEKILFSHGLENFEPSTTPLKAVC